MTSTEARTHTSNQLSYIELTKITYLLKQLLASKNQKDWSSRTHEVERIDEHLDIITKRSEYKIG